MSEEKQFSEMQKAAIGHFTGPALVIAGPGSGKTTVLTERIRFLIEKKGVMPESILALTFSKAAAVEMKERFKKMTDGQSAVRFATFHRFFFQILQGACHYDVSDIVTEGEKMKIMRDVIKREGIEEEETARCLLEEISLVKNNRIPPASYPSSVCPAALFQRIYRSYDEELKGAGKIDFDDMLVLAEDLLKKRPDLLQRWQERISFLLVDEFQDINPVQYEIVKLLAGKKANLFIVGDDDQSIYRFRGAEPGIMRGFEKDYPEAEKYFLSVNYRSTGRIITAAKNLIGRNEDRFEKDITGVREQGEKIVLSACKDQKEQAARLLDKIERTRKEGYSYKDMAVLYRTNLSAVLPAAQFTYQNIPFQTKEGIPDLAGHWITKDIAVYLKLAASDRSRASFFAVMNRPNRYLSRAAFPDDVVSFDALRTFYRDRPWMEKRIDQMEEDLAVLAKKEPADAVRFIRQTIGYDDFLSEYAKKQQAEQGAWFEVADLIEESAKGFRTAEEWLRFLEEEKRQKAGQKEQEEENAVHFLTMHGAKGLEFPVVFLILANEGVTPHPKAVTEADLEEERRLFYVAMTRAKDRLHILYVEELYRKKTKVSRFVEELQEEEPCLKQRR